MSEEDEFAKLPLPDQFAHKNWKARKGGYEAAAQHFRTAQPTDPLLRDFVYDSNLWKNAVSDSNVAAQQEALNAYNSFLEAAGTEGARKTRSSTVQGIVEKGLIGRPAAKAAALEGLLLLIELDKADPVIEELLPFFAHKQPKIIAAALGAVTAVFHAYGCKTVEPKSTVKLLPKVFGHADKNVRAEATALTAELYRWLREAMKPLFWGELKDLQQKELEGLFETIKAEAPPKQERLLRSQQAAVESAAAAGTLDDDVGADEEADEAPIDLEPEFETIDAFKSIPADFNDRLASTKWKDRKEALDELFTAVNHPALQEGPFDDVLRGCAKSFKDANIAVVSVAANCVEAIAKGLRKSFGRYKGTVLGSMLERFKEKKASVTDALAAACDAVFASTGLAEIEPEVLEALKSKNPQVKEHTAKFLIRSLKLTRDAPSLEQTKTLAEAAKALLSESVATLRDAGAEVLGVLWRIMGDRNMLAQLDGIDEIKKTKIKEFSDAAEVKAKWKPKAAPAPAAAKAAPPPAGGKKTTKRPAGAAPVKKAAPAPAARAASPGFIDDPPALQPRPTTRPATAKPTAGGLRAPVGLKAPSSGYGLTRPAAASPSRRPAAPLDDSSSTPLVKPSGLSRGLAGRPLAKPALAPASPPPVQESRQVSSLSATERQELSEVRAELDLLRDQLSTARSEKMKLQSQVAELQNQNAGLIEDHTRDVLVIKAKETQVVRARGDAEEAEERVRESGREVERLRREMGRLRDASTRSNNYGGGEENGYAVAGGNGETDREGKENIPSHSQSPPQSYSRERKLNGAAPTPAARQPHSYASSRPLSNGSSRQTSNPASEEDRGSVARSGSTTTREEGGVESWRRAAEVTQNLKARIELMKVRYIFSFSL